MDTYRIAVIPGDGIGKETVPEGPSCIDRHGDGAAEMEMIVVGVDGASCAPGGPRGVTPARPLREARYRGAGPISASSVVPSKWQATVIAMSALTVRPKGPRLPAASSVCRARPVRVVHGVGGDRERLWPSPRMWRAPSIEPTRVPTERARTFRRVRGRRHARVVGRRLTLVRGAPRYCHFRH